MLAAVALPSLDVLTASGGTWSRPPTHGGGMKLARIMARLASPERAGVTAALGLLVSAAGCGYRVTGQLPGVSL